MEQEMKNASVVQEEKANGGKKKIAKDGGGEVPPSSSTSSPSSSSSQPLAASRTNKCCDKYCKQLKFEIKQFKKCFSLNCPIRDWRIIFCCSSYPRVFGTLGLLTLRRLYCAGFLAAEINGQVKIIKKAVNAGAEYYGSYYIYFTNWTYFSNLIFLFCITIAHMYGLHTIKTARKILRECPSDFSRASADTRTGAGADRGPGGGEILNFRPNSFLPKRRRNLVKEMQWQWKKTDEGVGGGGGDVDAPTGPVGIGDTVVPDVEKGEAGRQAENLDGEEKGREKCCGMFGTVKELDDIDDNCGDIVETDLPIIARIAWVWYIIVMCSSFLTCLVFWFVLVPTNGLNLTFSAYWKHLCNFILLSIHALISRLPLFIPHISIIALFALCYVIMTVLVYALDIPNLEGGSGYVYNILDFKQSVGIATMSLVLIVLVLAPLVFYAVWSATYNKSYFFDPYDFPYAMCGDTQNDRHELNAENNNERSNKQKTEEEMKDVLVMQEKEEEKEREKKAEEQQNYLEKEHGEMKQKEKLDEEMTRAEKMLDEEEEKLKQKSTVFKDESDMYF